MMRLLPQKASFFDLFDKQAENMVELTREVSEMLQRFDRLPEREARVRELEHLGDEFTHQIATEVHATFVTPLDKEDITALASGLDDVVDYAESAAVRITLYQIPESNPDAQLLASLLVQVAETLRDLVSCLRSMKNRDRVIAGCRKLHRLEHDCDAVYRRAVGELFNTPGVDPIFVLKWKEIFERLEMAVDKAEDVSNIIESIQHKYA
jgi:uncharacterized protein